MENFIFLFSVFDEKNPATINFRSGENIKFDLNIWIVTFCKSSLKSTQNGVTYFYFLPALKKQLI